MLSVEETFGKGAKSYELEAKKHRYSAYGEVAKKLLKLLRPGSKILDIGVGTGLGSKIFIKSKYKVVGIDVSKEMLREASNYNYWKLYRMDFNKGLKFRRDGFDAVIMVAALEFSKNPKKLLKNIFKVLKNGGLFAVTMPIKQKRRMKYFKTFEQEKFEKILEKTGFRIRISKRIFGWKLKEGKLYYRLYVTEKHEP